MMTALYIQGRTECYLAGVSIAKAMSDAAALPNEVAVREKLELAVELILTEPSPSRSRMLKSVFLEGVRKYSEGESIRSQIEARFQDRLAALSRTNLYENS